MPLSTDDRLEILELAARYSHAVDHGDAEAYAGTFTDDGVFAAGGGEPVTGRAALAQTVTARPSDFVMRHFTSNPVIEGDGDSATMQLYIEVKVLGDQPRTLLLGRYRDQLRRVGGAWRFARRDVEVDYAAAP